MLKVFFTFLATVFIFSSTFASAGFRDGTLDCSMMRPIAQGFLTHHVAAKQLDLEHEGRTIEQFIKRLDPSKLYLLESDVAEIRGGMRGLFKKFGEDCAPIEKAHAILLKRLNESAEFAKKTLSTDGFKFAENTELQIDPNARKFAKNEKESQEMMMKFIQFQISNYLASDMKLPEAKKQLIHRYELNVKRQSEFKKDELYSLFLDAYATGLDAHSSYLSKDMVEDFQIQMKLSLEGIGAALTWEDGYTTVENLIPGGSAEKSGEVKPKDKIVSVAQGNGTFEQVIDMPLRDVVKLIRGKKGTTVRLTLLRQGAKETERLVVSLVRDKISLQDEAAKLTYTTRKDGARTLKIAVIDLPSFYGDMSSKSRSCYDDLKKLIVKARTEKADGIVLDLSKNGGGLLTEAVRIGGLFIGEGNIVATQNSRQELDALPDTDSNVDYAGPLVVLTSRLSASASEIVAGALQDYHRGLIVGSDHTFGKGTVQALMDLPAGLGAIKVTTGMFFIPGGASTQYRGVPADVVLPSIFSTKDVGEVSLDNSLQPKSIAPFLSDEANSSSEPAKHWDPVTPELIKQLKTLSSARVEKNDEFKKIKQELADMEKKKGVIKLSDSLKKQKEEKADPKSKMARRGKRASDDEYLKTPQVQEAVSVLVDMLNIKAKNTSSGNRS